MCAGPGGVGKTSLALAAAHAAADQFADGAAFVSLETLTDISLIRETVTQQLRVPALPGQAIDDSLLAFFGPRQMLLLVDNVERLGRGGTASRAGPGAGAQAESSGHQP